MPAATVKPRRGGSFTAAGGGSRYAGPAASKATTSAKPNTSHGDGGRAAPPVHTDAETLKTLYVRVKNPDDTDALTKLRSECSHYPGLSDMILVIGPDRQSAIKMPFHVDGSDELVGRLVKLLGEDSVVLK